MKFVTQARRITRKWEPYSKRDFRTGVNAAIREMGKIAVEMTSGTISTAQLRRMGHPFSRRRPNHRVPKLPINRQTGALKNALRVVRRVNGETEQIYLKANHPHAVVLLKGGTSKMIDRGFVQEFNKRTQGILRRHVLKVFRKR